MKGKKRFWQKVTVTVPGEWEEAATSLLMELGAGGVWVEKAGASVDLNVFFPGNGGERRAEKAVRTRLTERLPVRKIPIQSRLIPEEAWQTAWQARSVPRQRIGKRLMVAPPWDLPTAGRSRRKLIQVLPAMAFGTGTHPTTRNCLLFLEVCLADEKRPTLLDVGTGSGILAIAAAKLGAAGVTAVENDPVALEAAKENAKLNGVADRIVFRATIPRAARYACVVANLTAPTLLSLAPALVRKVS
ncbi:MAG TPA: 50S ribosomal protein L11 methyltransferase, partial [Candidatus Manganitrophaceae bacterium]|nr:50S ribosomal protein L11 methyltransferase [Candidatus Manganitrophaceae bacterium]